MEHRTRNRSLSLVLVLALFLAAPLTAKDKGNKNNQSDGMVVSNFLEKAKKNESWKTAFITGEQEQIVFMNISLKTNPKNEIGEETHSFDQAILVVEGRAQSILNGKKSEVKSGDLIFIPRGTVHNVVNLEKNKDLKIVSFYSATDMPKEGDYKTKADMPKD